MWCPSQLHEFCTTVANMGKIVVVAALDGTFAAQVRITALLCTLAALRWPVP